MGVLVWSPGINSMEKRECILPWFIFRVFSGICYYNISNGVTFQLFRRSGLVDISEVLNLAPSSVFLVNAMTCPTSMSVLVNPKTQLETVNPTTKPTTGPTVSTVLTIITKLVNFELNYEHMRFSLAHDVCAPSTHHRLKNLPVLPQHNPQRNCVATVYAPQTKTKINASQTVATKLLLVLQSAPMVHLAPCSL